MSTFLYDTTLRDGAQGEGVNFSVEDKLRIAQRLDDFGMHYIEGGWPGSNPKDATFFQRAQAIHWKHARLAAFGSTRKAYTRVEDDPQIRSLLEANTPVVTLVAKTSTLHVTHVLETSLEENLNMIRDSVAFFKQHGKEVVHDAEHFFDGFKLDKEYALATLRAARDAGADWLVLCDTNGGTMPWEVEEIVRYTIQTLRAEAPHRSIRFGIHAHNDAGVAVANSLAAVRAGCEQVQGTINGIGERVGNCDLVTTLANLKLKMNDDCVSDEKLRGLTELSRFVFEVANLTPDIRQPYVGQAAFAHKGGIHVAAILKVEESYQHIDPARVGNRKRVLVSELSGRGNIAYKAKEFGLNPDSVEVRQVLQRIKELENRGFFFEGADASVELMLRRAQPGYTPLFELLDYMVVVEHREGRGVLAEASVKIRVDGEVTHTVAEGNGPIHALDLATRKALLPHYPKLKRVRLVDYKVRIIDSDQATGATTRVTIDSTNGHRSWTTVGSSANIVDASWQALADSMEYALLIV
ncbi:MAG: citramalate synthase [Thermoflexales bacterium]|nr:citramalate synthase [Thermoflexales bacterium]MCS7324005.1 citramalate synthase [Thermoflexales bacterium]MCX7937929.1 citramalate synthase [Thermoflexales bacterium]MDW8052945.1 citramalate synthase [Anaerolineae bacterium]MDW8291596.1 citramalate synthase [Anaerolineae bacterium]